MLIERTRIKDKILKASREKKQITYKGTLIRLLADFRWKLQVRREWHNILKVMKGRKPPKIAQEGFHSDLKEKSKAL